MKKINKEKFLELYNQGKKDTEIAVELNVGRKLVGKYRKTLDLQSQKEKSIIHDFEYINKVKELAGIFSDRIIASKLNVSIYQVKAIRNLYNLPKYNSKVINKDKEDKLIELYNQGKMDTEIGKILGIKSATIQAYRSTHNMPTKFTYDKISKIDNNKFEKLFKQGLSDYAIAKELNMSPDGVHSHRVRHNYIRKENLRINKAIKLTSFQKQVLIGTMLGDSNMRLSKNCVSPRVSCAHGVKQKKYCEYKTEIFKSLGAKCNYHKRNVADKRNGIYYEDYTMSIPANPEFSFYYNSFYPNGKKIIPLNLLNQFTEVSLAFMFMDDGTKTSNGYSVATMCFDKENIIEFKKFLANKYHIETTIHKNNSLYIKANSRNLFTHLISPYIIDCMKYKIHSLVTS